MKMKKNEIVPNISNFLVGKKTAIPQKGGGRSGHWFVSFKIEMVRTYKVAAKTKGMASELGRNRLKRTIKNLEKKHTTKNKNRNLVVTSHKLLSTNR